MLGLQAKLPYIGRIFAKPPSNGGSAKPPPKVKLPSIGYGSTKQRVISPNQAFSYDMHSIAQR